MLRLVARTGASRQDDWLVTSDWLENQRSFDTIGQSRAHRRQGAWRERRMWAIEGCGCHVWAHVHGKMMDQRSKRMHGPTSQPRFDTFRHKSVQNRLPEEPQTGHRPRVQNRPQPSRAAQIRQHVLQTGAPWTRSGSWWCRARWSRQSAARSCP